MVDSEHPSILSLDVAKGRSQKKLGKAHKWGISETRESKSKPSEHAARKTKERVVRWVGCAHNGPRTHGREVSQKTSCHRISCNALLCTESNVRRRPQAQVPHDRPHSSASLGSQSPPLSQHTHALSPSAPSLWNRHTAYAAFQGTHTHKLSFPWHWNLCFNQLILN